MENSILVAHWNQTGHCSDGLNRLEAIGEERPTGSEAALSSWLWCQGVLYQGHVSPRPLQAPTRGEREQLEYLQFGLAKWNESLLSPF